MPGLEPTVISIVLASAASVIGSIALYLWRQAHKLWQQELERRQELEREQIKDRERLTDLEDKQEMMGLSVYGHPSDPNQPGLVERIKCMEDGDEDCWEGRNG